jgi:hypothetical protein
MFTGMKATFGQSTILVGTIGAMPPRWGLEFVGEVACYKHVAPPALSPLARNGEFARRVTAVEKLETLQRASLAEMVEHFVTLQPPSFRGKS